VFLAPFLYHNETVWTELEKAGFIILPRDRKPKRGYIKGGWYILKTSPTNDDITLLRRVLKTVDPYSVEVAVDLLCQDEDTAAAELKRIYIDQPYSRTGNVKFEGGDTYYTNRQHRTGYAAYSDRLSYIAGLPCVHLEYRVYGLRHLRRIGIGKIEDLIDYDCAAYWHKALPRILRWVDYAEFGRKIDNHMKGTRRQETTKRDRMLGHACIRASKLYGLPLYRPYKRWLGRVDVSEVLPLIEDVPNSAVGRAGKNRYFAGESELKTQLHAFINVVT
jgi:hypothetical protein